MEFVDDDIRLMLRYQEGDLEAFAALYTRHKGPLYRYLLRQVRNASAAADLFQDVWSRLVATRARYEPRAKFATYLFHIAHNCAIDFYRRDLKVRLGAQVADGDMPGFEPAVPEHQHPDRMMEYIEQQSALLVALAALPAEQREAFVLYEEAGLSIEDIAHVTNVPAETAKSRLRYAIRKLKKSLHSTVMPAASSAAASATMKSVSP
jgi:RNA polymerase sigma-70 factor (ECF subfamily)